MKLIACSIALFSIIQLQAQRFGGDKPLVKWRQVNTDAAKIIFPEGLDSTAMRIASIVDRLNENTLSTIGERSKRISIVLHPNTVISNGYVALGPFRSEFYLTPSANSFELGSIAWHDMLAIHEYRHVQQYNNFNVGLSKVFHVLFGQNGQALANALTVPNWFFEGDAVYQETLVSKQGRGRISFFYDDYRSLWLANKQYSYMKLRNGSLRDFTPDHYRLGYMLVAYGREKYGDEFWKNVTHDAAAFKGLFYPFQKAVKQYSGKSFSTFTKDAINYFKQQSLSQRSGNTIPAQPTQHFIGDQEFPVYTNDGNIIYVNSSYKTVPAFIQQKGTEERKIRTRDVSLDNQFSYANGKIVYSSYHPGVRWSWNDFNELQVLDVNTGDQKTITHHSKYFSPALSKDGNRIVAVDVEPNERSQLHVLNALTGEVLQKLPNADRLFYTYPQFLNNNAILSAIRKPTGEMALVSIDEKDGAVNYLTPASLRIIGNPFVQNDTIYFTASDKTYDRLFAVSLSTKQLFRSSVVPDGIGIYQPAISNDKIIFSSFTANGYRLQQVNRNDIQWQQVSENEWQEAGIPIGIDLTKNKASGLLQKVTTQRYDVDKYSRTSGLINFHSLFPYADDPNYTLSVVGNNVLNTMESEIFFTYNRDEQYKQLGFNATYGGLFPYIIAGANYTIDRRDFIATNKPAVYWNEAQVNIGLSIPLNLSKGKSITGLTFGADYVFKEVKFKGFYKDTFNSLNLGYINSYVSFTNQIQQARQHIYPHFAQSIYINYRNAIQAVEANQFLASGSLYFPGFAATHSFMINLAYQHRDTSNEYRYSNGFPFSRGYESPNLREMYKWGVNYHLPLAYPDWGFGGIVYFQRIRTNLFYDYTIGNVAYNNGLRLNTDFRSTGAEIFFDTKWWNQLNLNVGFRYSHLLDPDLFGGTGAERFEFILPVNLFQR